MQAETQVGHQLSPYNKKYTLAQDAIKVILKHQDQYFDETDLLALRGVCTAFKSDVDKINFFTNFFLKKVLLNRQAISSPISTFINTLSTPSLYAAIAKAFATLDKSLLEDWHTEFFSLMLDCLVTDPEMVCRLVEICFDIDLVSNDLKTFTVSKKAIFDFLTKPIMDFSPENENELLTHVEMLHQEGGCTSNQCAALQMSIQASYAQLRGDNSLSECYCYKNLSRGNFNNAILVYANFEAANLKGARFNGAKLSGSNFEGANLSFVHFDRAYLLMATFAGANLEGARFECAKLEGAHFEEANLKGVDFMYAQLRRANFEAANLERVAFQGAMLNCANFGGAHLEEANFARATLVGANFEKAHLYDVNLIGANFLTANFNLAECSGCKLFDRGNEKQNQEVLSTLRSAVERDASNIAPLLFSITAASLSQLSPHLVMCLKNLANECLAEVLKNISFEGFFWLIQKTVFIHFREESIFGYSPLFHPNAKDTYPHAVKLVTETYIRLCRKWGFDEEKATQHQQISAVLITLLQETKGFFTKAWDELIDQLQMGPFINALENEQDKYRDRSLMQVGVH